MTARPIRIARYSRDTMGVGHTRRNLLLAETLAAAPECPSVLPVSGSREIARTVRAPQARAPIEPAFDVACNPAQLNARFGAHGRTPHATVAS